MKNDNISILRKYSEWKAMKMNSQLFVNDEEFLAEIKMDQFCYACMIEFGKIYERLNELDNKFNDLRDECSEILDTE